jgi:hypothetical protein
MTHGSQQYTVMNYMRLSDSGRFNSEIPVGEDSANSSILCDLQKENHNSYVKIYPVIVAVLSKIHCHYRWKNEKCS